MKQWRRYLRMALRLWAGRVAFLKIKRHSLLVYLRALQKVRKGLMGALLGLIFAQLAVFALLGSIISGLFLIPVDPHTRLWILFAVLTTIWLLAAIVVAYLLSERVWLRASGAKQYLHSEDGE